MLRFLKALSLPKPLTVAAPAAPPLGATSILSPLTTPLRLPIAQLADYAHELAAQHEIAPPPPSQPLLRHLRTAEANLAHVHATLARDAETSQVTVPAAAWLLDNNYVIEQQIAEVRVDLPERYYRQLPKLASGEYADYPRTYVLAQALIHASDGALTTERITTFVREYQAAGQELTIGELWSVAIMLRLALIERLSELARQMLAARRDWQRADAFARLIQQQLDARPGRKVNLPPTLTQSRRPLTPIFATRLHRLREQGEAVRPVLDWLDRRLAQQSQTTADMVQLETRQLTGMEELVGNIITSLRQLSALDWANFVEELSHAEAVLRRDPAAVYPLMDFATRDQYRHAVEELARHSKASEVQVAEHALALARRQPISEDSSNPLDSDPQQHIGYYIVDAGRGELEQTIGYQPPPLARLAAAIERHPNRFYLGALGLVTGGLVGIAAAYAKRHDGKRGAVAAAALATVPASALAASLVNHLITTLVQPRVLPKLELEGGLPPNLGTVVVVPILLTSAEGVYELLEHLEILALANASANLQFVILSDFADADAEALPEDADRLHRIVAGINDLNAHHSSTGRRFHLFHRDRKWNPAQGKWMAWERKRGKLTEFNDFLLTGNTAAFSTIIGDTAQLAETRFVITLDADTELPPGAPLQLIGTLAHPLNRPAFNDAGRVVRGYGILQPRVQTTLLSGIASPFAHLSSGHTGVDPYTTAVSDVYQDLFGDGIFMGKGAYDLKAFARAMQGRFPENALLSHDLIEGLYARAALVSDVTLYDDQPSRYLVAVRRAHRWIRGDWQILPWLFPRVPGEHGPQPNILPPAARWKIFDNLRRSLEATGLVAMLVTGWAALPGRPLRWTMLATFVRAFPTVTNLLFTIPRRPPATAWPRHLGYVLKETRQNLAHLAMTTSLLPDQALSELDAIIRTLWRLYHSRRNLLEWTTAADSQRKLGNTLPDHLRAMWTSPALAAAAAALVLLRRPRAIFTAAPYLAAWAAAPYIAYRLSQPTPPPSHEISADDTAYLRRAARQTWRYFTTFVNAAENWLPPDNYQEDPQPVVAHRTSPTNISLALLANLAARDFGYLTSSALAARLEQQLDSVESLERYRGHLYNWYDTLTKQPLLPQYISTVDSGNLAGHLVTLKHGCLHRSNQPILGPELLRGLADTLTLLEETASAKGIAALLTATQLDLQSEIQSLKSNLADVPTTLTEWSDRLDAVAEAAQELNAAAVALPLPKKGASDPAAEVRYWAVQLAAEADAAQQELRTLLPFVPLLCQPPAAFSDPRYAKIFALWQQVSPPPADIWPSAIIGWCAGVLPQLRQLRTLITRGGLPVTAAVPALDWLDAFTAAVAAAWTASEQLTGRLRDLARRCQSIVELMHFDFLFDDERELFVIGYNVAAQRRDNSYYDLLASEARLASFLAVARGEVPLSHWFHLGRARTSACNSYALLSWTGTMFEYLMPNLVMRSYPNSLIEQSNTAAVCRQQQYGRERSIPWGISESAFNVRDRDQNYQYRAFGVPGLGLKRGLSNDLVVAPYATMLALLVDPTAAVANLRRLSKAAAGRFGFYDAVDYTHSRLPVNADYAPVRSYMVHHQGMSLVALDEAINGQPMVARFHSEAQVQAVELLLQERIPLEAPITQPRATEVDALRTPRRPATANSHEGDVRHFTTANTAIPEAHFLSNGRYHLMLTNSGSGYSQWQQLAVTRWQRDATAEGWGSYFYIRDMRSGKVWSSGYQPTASIPEGYGATFALDEAAIWRRDDGIETRTVVVVSPDDDAEVRQITLTNTSTRPREIEVTGYAEVVLNTAAADAAHPAFSKLFVETEKVADVDALLASRRPRTANEPRVWLAHTLAVEGDVRGELEYETDRARFIGRGRSLAQPAALDEGATLSGTVGAVLDPILSLRRRVRLAPGERATFTYATAIATDPAAARALAHRYASPAAGERARRFAASLNSFRRQQRNVGSDEAMLYQLLASRIVYPDPALRAPAAILAQNERGQSSLWAYGISGDFPIVLVSIRDIRDTAVLGELLRAHEYLTWVGLTTDLVVLNEYDSGYQQPLNDQLLNLILNSPEAETYNQRGGVFLLRADNMPPEDRTLLYSVARLTLAGEAGSLAPQLARRAAFTIRPAALQPKHLPAPNNSPLTNFNLKSKINNLKSFNGLGGFSADGKEYVIHLAPDVATPAPWTNVIANPNFGCLVTELGAGVTWAENSRENRLTTWSNDPISDPPAEVIYLRDEETGEFWSATPAPIRQPVDYLVRHGQGYTVYEHHSHAIHHKLEVSVPPDAPLKRWQLQLRNDSDQPRKLRLTYYAELVMGVSRDIARYIVSDWDADAQTLLAHNPYNNEFAPRYAFAASSHPLAGYTADRGEFLGRLGTTSQPAAMRRVALGKRSGAGFDPCFALQVSIELAPGAAETVSFFLGEGEGRAAAVHLAVNQREAAAETVAWDDLLSRVQVETPDPATDLLLNRWLLYQTIACRLWARSGFYQGGGAYGFRDQLQDVMATVYAAPELARAQILRAAARQFREGDVQHWWHPPTGRGVRTRFSDDLLWLPYVVAFYLEASGDRTILDEQVPFIEAAALQPGQEDAYLYPSVSNEVGSIYEHCVRTLRRGSTHGPHDLPLMGAGDWNDGMNRVGIEGKGESVWLAWFLASTLDHFSPIAESCGDMETAAWCRQQRVKLVNAVEQAGWDGAWYRRAYFDDGTPLGSAENDECQIDAIAQSWSVISGFGNPARQRQALAAVNRHLIRDDDKLSLLLTPAFDKTELDPGYIKGYLLGVRENGGQYTHAAIWTALAFAKSGDAERAYQLFQYLNPINHSLDAESLARYKVEPYVVAADVYSHPMHIGRGGWTWYTGSAAWLYRLGLETILGFTLHGDYFTLTPTIPAAWPGFRLTYHYRRSSYHVEVQRGPAPNVTLDGQPLPDARVPLQDDGGEHQVSVTI